MSRQEWMRTRREQYQAALEREHEEGIQAGCRWFAEDTDIDGDVQVRLDRLRGCDCHLGMNSQELADVLFDGLDEESAEAFWTEWAGEAHPSELFLYGFLLGSWEAFDACNSAPVPLPMPALPV